MSFTNSSGFSFKGDSTFNHVEGNQVNSTINAGTVNFNAGQRAVERTEYNQFREVIRGDMIKLKELHSEELKEWDWVWQNGKLVGRCKASAQRTIYTVDLVDRQSKYTAMVYEGKAAQNFWEKDFREFSHTNNPQLFGINQSAIPSLIFHHELIPLAHFFNKKSIWMNLYIRHLTNTRMGYWKDRVWMNTTDGVLFRGPDGPSLPNLESDAIESIVVPITVDMLKDDTCFRFFSSFGSSMDNIVLECAWRNHKYTDLDDLVPGTAAGDQSQGFEYSDWSSATKSYLRKIWRNPPGHLPMNTIGRLRLDTVYSPSSTEAVAVARWPQGAGSLWDWAQWWPKGLVEETEHGSGLTCFRLDPTRGEEVYLDAEYDWRRFWKGWLSQSLHVFDAIHATEGKENFFVVDPPDLRIRSILRPTASATLRNDQDPIEETASRAVPIYLFLHPLPMSVSDLVFWMDGHFYFWSFDETGQSRMSEEECERWGLPVLTISMPCGFNFVQLRSWPTHIYTALQDWQKVRGFDPATSDWAQELGHLEFEILDKKANGSWWEAILGSGISAVAV